MPKLYCYSHSNFRRKLEAEQWNDENLPLDSAFICIGCTPECQEYCGPSFALFDTFDLNNSHSNVLQVRFDDIDSQTVVAEDSNVAGRFYTITGVTDAQAKIIVDFIDNNIGKDFYIHCNAGKSRSQAVVRYILDAYRNMEWELNPDNMNVTWNNFVYKKLMNAKFDN